MSPTRPEDMEEGSTVGKAAKPGFFYGYVVTAAAFFVWLVGFGAHTTSFGVFFKPLLTEFGWTRADTVLGYSLSICISGFLGIFAGWLTDRLGPRIVMIVFGSFLGICYLLLSQVSAVWQFQLYYASMASIGASALLVPIMATIARWFVKRRGLMTGITQTGASVGGLIFAPLAGWLILTYGWRSAYIIIGIITLAVIIISGLFLRRDPRDIGQLPDGASGIMAPEAKKQGLSLQAAGLSLQEAIRTSQFWMIVGLYFSFGFLRSTFLAHIAAHVQDLGFSLAHGSNILAAIMAASIVGRIGMGRVADIIGNRSAFMISYTGTAVILIWGLVTEDLWGLYLFALVFGFGWGAQAVLRFAVASEAFGLVSLGLFMGVFVLAEAGAATLGSYFAGYNFDIVGSYDPAFWMGIALAIIGITLAWLLKPIIRKGGNSGGE